MYILLTSISVSKIIYENQHLKYYICVSSVNIVYVIYGDYLS